MAIDLLVMPLSRYWAGDYVLPAMELAWSLDIPYGIVGPSGTRIIPPGERFGGPGTELARRGYLRQLPEALRALDVGLNAGATWNEEDDAAPFFARPDSASFGALVADARRNVDREPGFLDRLLGRSARRSHLAHARILLPAPFDGVPSHEGVTFGSLFRALEEIETVVWSPTSVEAARDVREALETARARQLPMIVDL